MRTVWNDLRRAEPKATQAPEVTQADSGHCAAPGQPSPGFSPSPPTRVLVPRVGAGSRCGGPTPAAGAGRAVPGSQVTPTAPQGAGHGPAGAWAPTGDAQGRGRDTNTDIRVRKWSRVTPSSARLRFTVRKRPATLGSRAGSGGEPQRSTGK